MPVFVQLGRAARHVGTAAVKLIKQVSLYFQEGRSDKVYEVDLCEVGPDQYVVNFRYGRRGTALRDGSKTPAPVPLAEAERVFDSVVEEKLAKGYKHSPPSGPPEKAEVPSAPVAGSIGGGSTGSDSAGVEEELDPRRRAILARLARGDEAPPARRRRAAPQAWWPLSRAVWRAGELRLRQAEPMLPGLIGSGEPMLDYCVAWALGQCGSTRSIPALQELRDKADAPDMVRRMAAEGVRMLLDDQLRAEAIRQSINHLPESLSRLAAAGPPDEFKQALTEYLDGADYRAFAVLDTLYFIDNQYVRPALLEILRTSPLAPNYFQRIRHIFKVAEMRRDAEVFGIIAQRVETTPGRFSANSYLYMYGHRQKPMLGPQAEKAFSRETRLHFRRRVWWTLRRLGELDDRDYTRLAVGVLLAFTDADAGSPRRDVRYDWSSYHSSGRYEQVTTYWDSWGKYWALNHILYHNSPRYEVDRGKRGFSCTDPYVPGGRPPDAREEAFPELWEKYPDELWRLLTESRCGVVHKFAAKAMRACQDFCRDLEIEDLLILLASAYQVTVELGFDLAVSRYNPVDPDRRLVLALANCGLERARRQAHTWIQPQRDFFFQDTGFAVALVGSPYADTREFARKSLGIMALGDAAAEAIIGRLFGFLQSLGAQDGELAGDVAKTLLEVFGRQLRTIGPDVIRDLLSHPLAELQQFAGNLVLGHETLSQHPPDDVLEALLKATDAGVRGVGVQIIGQLPNDVLVRSTRLLVSLSTHELPDVRDAIRPIVVRLAGSDAEFGRKMGEMLIEEILTPGAPEGVPSHTARILREDLREHLASITAETVWRLLQSRSSPAQEVGGLLLSTNVRVEELSVGEVVKLAGHDILSVRTSARRMFAQNLDRMRENLTDAVEIIDSKWEDTRQFAFQLFRDHFSEGDLSPAILVGICDSVRSDVQQFGRELITRFFEETHGQEYLVKLSEHPSGSLQLFASNFLERYASDSPERLRELEPYFVSVLSRVNKGRIAKDRVFAFLQAEALKSEQSARTVGEILTRQSVTAAIGDKANTIQMMLKIRAAYPAIPLPLEVEPVEARRGV